MTAPLEQTLQSAIQLHQAGRLKEADALYLQILAENPHHAGALHLRGLVAWQSGNSTLAESLIRRAVELGPNEAAFLGNLSKLLTQLGRHEEAIQRARRVAELQPQNAAAHYDLAAAFQAAGASAQAMQMYQESIRLNPQYAEAHNNLGVLLKSLGRLDEALAHFQRAAELNPAYALAHANMGEIHQAKGDHLRAVDCFRAAVRLAPNNPAMHFSLGASLFELRRGEETIAAYYRARALKPDNPTVHNNLGNVFRELGRLDEAEACYREALRLNPDLMEPYSNLGIVLSEKGDPAAVDYHRRAVELGPQHAIAHSNLLYTLHFHPASTPQSLLQEHLEWDRRHAQPLKSLIEPHANIRDPNRRLRIGYVSPDFRGHAVGRFMLPLLSHHHHKAFEIFCFSDVRTPDAMTDRLRAQCDQWRSIAGLSHRQAADVIRREQIDILIDLAMHLDSSRLLVFAQKPAPVQITYLAYCSTTGMDTIDYRITDSFLDPPGTDANYTEQSIRIESYWCYDQNTEVPSVGPLPALKNGYITFGCLNNFMKVSPDTLETWARLLQSVPHSQLLIHADPGSHQERVRSFLAAAGIAPERCRFTHQVPTSDYFQLYHQIDIALDPFPWAGGTTTCDALYMGVPTITLAGKTAVGRGGASILSHVGLPDLIANDVEQYIQIASQLAGDLPRLAHLRSTLRRQMQSSPLMDAPRFTRQIEAAYSQAWKKWCSSDRDEQHDTRAIEQAFQQALRHHQAGRLPQAQAAYEQLLAQEPAHHMALHNLAVIKSHLGQHEAALDLMNRALSLEPHNASCHCNLAKILIEMKHYDRAVQSARQALQLQPQLLEAHLNLALALSGLGQIEESIAASRQALAINPHIADAHFHLSHLHLARGQIDAALAACREGLRIRPADAMGHAHLGNLLTLKNQIDEALAACRHSLQLNPNLAAAQNNLGCALIKRRHIDQAARAFREAIRLDPAMPQAYANLGAALHTAGEVDEAIAACREALKIDPTFIDALHNLGVSLKDSARTDQAIAAYREILCLAPSLHDAHSNLIYILHLHPDYDAPAIGRELRAWNDRHARPFQSSIQRHLNDRSPDRPLRVGYVSADFREHPVGRFALPLITHHNHQQFQITCYSNLAAPDVITTRFRAAASQWRDIAGLSDQDVAELIRSDGIDILVDLSMHTDGNRLLVFARKPAPIQVTWLAYAGSSGLTAMDYRLTDPYLDPLGTDLNVYSEKSIRLPETFWCYQASPEAPAINALPARQNGAVTFGSLNNFGKVSQKTQECWARLLLANPHSRLLIYAGSGSHRDAFLQLLARAGIEPSRCQFLSRAPAAGYFARYHQIDIALDTFPCTGGTTTCDALYMGVPVITLKGHTAVGRGGASILSNIGLPELIASNLEQYIHIATELAGNLPYLASLRSTLRARMQSSPLMDAPHFARNIETAYRHMWQTWCAKSP